MLVVDFSRQAPGSWLLQNASWTRGQHRISAVAASAVEAALLQVPAGTACLVIDRQTWRGEQPITWVRQMSKNEVGLAEFKKAMDGGTDQVILDVRTKDEVQTGAFKNSISIPLDQIEKRIGELPKDKEMLIHCSTGARAEMAKSALDKAGLKSRVLIADVECEQGKCEIKD